MKIIYIHQYFKTPNEPGGTRSYWISKELVKRGHEVIMLTTSSTIEKNIQVVDVEGIQVVYFRVRYEQQMNVLRRLFSFLHFMYISTYYLFKLKKIDLIIATSTPLTVGFPALVYKFIKKTPYIFEVRDLWPEVPIQMGAIRNSIIKYFAISFEKLIYNNAKHVIALSPGMAEGVEKFISKDKVSLIPNMSKIDEFFPRDINFELFDQLHLKRDTFKVVHFGSLGQANGVDSIIESAKFLKNDNTIEFVFLGGGSTENILKEKCSNLKLTNVRFLGNFPMNITSEIVNMCDVSIVSFLDIPILYTNSPNKLFDSLSAGKPIIVNSAGWTKRLVEDYRCGFYANPNSPEDLASKIKILQTNKELFIEFGRNSRSLAINSFDKSILCPKFVDIIEK